MFSRQQKRQDGWKRAVIIVQGRSAGRLIKIPIEFIKFAL